ncbi:hypothetical protein AN191_10520 [Loktanella sp. 5RATIMAR09]|nr:hypothetical protein AN191_10520 [Loktanella sp. 5RATIMAR09]
MWQHGEGMETVTTYLRATMVPALRQIGDAGDLLIGHIVRAAIKRDLYRRTRAKTARRAG